MQIPIGIFGVSASLTLGRGLAKMTCQAEVTNLEDPVPQLGPAGRAKSLRVSVIVHLNIVVGIACLVMRKSN